MVDAEVTLQGESVLLTTVTDSDGYYRFNDVDGGIYKVNLVLPGSTTIDIIKPTKNTSINGINFSIQTSTTRQLSSGTVVGSIENNGTFVWRGIPYATPPVEERRWQHAVAAQSWEEEYLALTNAQPCAQIADITIEVPLSKVGEVAGAEDCLYLNIWTPSFDSIPVGDETKPVMFWIHGGGNTTGGSSLYDGKMLANRYGVIVVAVSYRLGVFGWMSHPALRYGAADSITQSNNYGLTDIIRALHWVQENIGQFGGDTDRVMIFGESAGGYNVTALLASPYAEGIFHRAATQSGGFPWAEQTAAENYQEEGGAKYSSREIINRLLVNDNTATDVDEARILQDEMIDPEIELYLRSQSPEDLLSLFDDAAFGMYRYSTIIRDDIVIPDQDPFELISAGLYHQVPILLGSNRDEFKLFMAFDPEFTVGGLGFLIRDKNYYALTSHYMSQLWKATAVDKAARLFSAVQGDSVQGNSVYAYRFDWDEQPTILFSDIAEITGATHSLEIPFVFATPNKFPSSDFFAVMLSPANKEGRVALANSMSSYWAAFAYTGDPGMGVNESEPVRWMPWDNDQETNKMIILDTPQGTLQATLQDKGIRMSQDELTLDSFRQALRDEAGFTNHDQKCRTYLRTFNNDAWYRYLIDSGDTWYQENCMQ